MATLPATATVTATASDPPRLAPGLELIGRYRDSGFREAPYLVRHPDGRFAQLPELLYIVAAHADGRTPLDAIARAASERIGRAVSANNVAVLLDKLRAAGIVADGDGAVAPGRRVDPLLALRFRAAVVPAGLTRLTSVVLRPLFLPAVVAAALAGLVALDAWLFFAHGVAQSAREILMHPALLLAVLGLVVAGTVFHEMGHAAACAYGGARPGAMGIGLYLVWPAFYTDVTDAYRLGRAGRVRTDLGGVYFNALFAVAAGGAFLATHAEFLVAVVLVQHVQILQQLMPWGRLDGYYVLTDLTGVPDMLSRVGAILRSLLPGRRDEPSVRALKPWVRTVATAYVLTLVPVAALTVALILAGAPRVVATALASLTIHLHAATVALHHAQWTAAALAAVQTVTLVTPALGMTLMALGVARRLLAAAANWSPLVVAAAASIAGAAAVTACLAWWPGAGTTSAMRADARGTVHEGVSARTRAVAADAHAAAATHEAHRGDSPRPDDRASTAGATTAAARRQVGASPPDRSTARTGDAAPARSRAAAPAARRHDSQSAPSSPPRRPPHEPPADRSRPDAGPAPLPGAPPDAPSAPAAGETTPAPGPPHSAAPGAAPAAPAAPTAPAPDAATAAAPAAPAPTPPPDAPPTTTPTTTPTNPTATNGTDPATTTTEPPTTTTAPDPAPPATATTPGAPSSAGR